jgi:hypothetical protein
METGRKKCIVMDCANHTDEGKFIGDLCAPCHEFVATGRGVHSQAYRNAKRIEPRRVTFDLEFLALDDDDRSVLKCLFCGLTGCDHAFALYGRLPRYMMVGIHAACLDSHEGTVASLKERKLL